MRSVLDFNFIAYDTAHSDHCRASLHYGYLLRHWLSYRTLAPKRESSFQTRSFSTGESYSCMTKSKVLRCACETRRQLRRIKYSHSWQDTYRYFDPDIHLRAVPVGTVRDPSTTPSPSRPLFVAGRLRDWVATLPYHPPCGEISKMR